MTDEQKSPEVKTVKKEPKLYFEKNTNEILTHAISANLPVLLVGDTGTGKTSLVRNIANKEGKKLIRLNLTGQTGVDEILGKWLVNMTQGTYWLDGLLVSAMRKGDWIVLDEINMALPEILSSLHSLLDDDHSIVLKEKDGEIVLPHPDFRFFATMNPCDEYAGTKELNKAFLSRFPVVIETQYSKYEPKILKDRANIDDATVDILMMLANEIRSSCKKKLISFSCSTRDLIYAAKMIASGINIIDAVKVSIINKAPAEEQKAIMSILKLITAKDIPYVRKDGSKVKFQNIQEMFEKFGEIEEQTKVLDLANTELRNEIKLRKTEIDQTLKKLETSESLSNEMKAKIEKLTGKKVEVKEVKEPETIEEALDIKK